MNIVGQDKPSPEELVHYGVKGMKWGERRAQNKAARQQRRQERNDMIDKARAELSSGRSRQAIRDAKVQFKQNKRTMGRREAKRPLIEARQNHRQNQHVARLHKSGAETTVAILTAVGGIAASTIIKAAAAQRNIPTAPVARSPIRLQQDPVTGVFHQ